ncbi:MAG: peptidoglycan editing factor PgeF [Campylobacterota bacterium]
MQYLTGKILQKFPQVSHIFTTRHGGLSQAPFSSNNLAFHVGDNTDDVIRNHQKLAQQMEYDYPSLIHMRQIHSDKVVTVDSALHHFDSPPECDALITDEPNTPLMVMTADCTPVLLFDSVQNVIAVVHAGRVGAVKGIVPKTIEKMCHNFGSKIEDINVLLGPSIHGCCYEVGETIAREVIGEGYGFAVITKEDSYYLEVNAIIKKQLEAIGIKKEKLEDLNICNACENQDFFSYRADKQKTGRIAGVLMLKS